MPTAAALTLALAAFGASGTDASSDRAVSIDLSWLVTLDENGHVTALEGLDAKREKLPQIRQALEPKIRAWSFTPGQVDGKRASTQTALELAVSVSRSEGDGLHIRIDSVHTGGHVVKYTIPHFPRSAMRAAQDKGPQRVAVKAHYDAKGKVTAATITDDTATVARDVQQSALDAVEQWHFEPERVAGHGVPADVYVPLCFQATRARPASSPGSDCSWTPPGQKETVGAGKAVAVQPVAVLVTPVVGVGVEG